MEKFVVEMKIEQIKEFKAHLIQQEKAMATIRKYITDIRTFYHYLGKNNMVDKQRILDYKKWLMDSYSVSSVNSMLAALNQFLTFLQLNSFKVKSIKVQKSFFLREEKELTREEYKLLLKTSVNEGKIQLALCMETIACTGIRISELQFFTVEAIKKEFIEIFNKGKYRRIFLPKDLKKIVNVY